MSKTVKLLFKRRLRDNGRLDRKGKPLKEKIYEAGETYDIDEKSVNRWLKRGCELVGKDKDDADKEAEEAKKLQEAEDKEAEEKAAKKTKKDKEDKAKADKEKADKEKADKEKADKEKADKEKADKKANSL